MADGSQTVEELRAAGQYVVITPQDAVERCRRQELRVVTAHPLCGGLPEEPSWESLRLICDEVMPKVRTPEALSHDDAGTGMSGENLR